MKEYDFKKLKKIIIDNKAGLVCASLGIYEDYYWTGEMVWEKGDKFTIKKKEIGGITGSSWGTPFVLLEFDGHQFRAISCFVGGSTRERSIGAGLGCLSGPAQDNLPRLEE